MNNIKLVILSLLLTIGFANIAFATDTDDVKWINSCIADNKHEGQSEETVTKYCACMNDNMSSSETKSVTEWEKTHPKVEEKCEKAAGWVNN